MRDSFLLKRLCPVLIFLQFIHLNTVEAQITQAELESAAKANFDPTFVETRDTVSKYGPISITRNMLQARNGIYWFATWQGIMSYDGKLFTNHTLKEGLIHFHVFSIFQDKKGNLWFGTARGGLYLYNGKSFKLFTTKDGIPDNTVMCMTEDKKGNIWFGTENGASRYDGKNFVNFTTKDGLSSNYVGSILNDKTGNLWFGCDGLSRYDGNTFTPILKKDGQPFARIASLLADKNGNIWIGSMNGLCRYHGNTMSDFIIPKLVMYMYEDKKGNILLAYNDYPRNQNFTLYHYNKKKFNKILEQNDGDNWAIFGMIEDNRGNIWYGTGRGVYRYNGRSLTNFKENIH